MRLRTRAFALLLAPGLGLGCRGDDRSELGGSDVDESSSGVDESTGDGDPTGDGDGDPQLPGWPCDPLARLAASAPEQPPALGESSSGIAVLGELVVACREAAPLEIWSTADDALSLLATVELEGEGCKWVTITADGQTVAVSDPGALDSAGFVQVIDIGDPRAPIAGASVSGVGFEGLAVRESAGELLVAARSDGVLAFALPELEPRPGYADDESDAHALLLVDEHLWVAEGIHGVRRFEWSAPMLGPSPVSSVALAGVSQDLALATLDGAAHLLIANLGGVIAIDLASETISSTGPTRGASLRLAELGDDRVALADWDALRVVDFADVKVPRIVAHQGELGGPTGGLFGVRDVLALADDRLISAGLRGLELWAYDRTCEAPALASESRRLHYAPDRDDRVLNLLNEGTVELEILALTSDDPSISALPESFVLPPGGIQAVEVAIEHGDARVSELEVHAVHPDTEPGRVEICADCPGIAVGDEAPPLIHVDIHGELWSRERMAGRVVLLAYFATWCGTCNDDLPLFETELWQAYVDAGGLVVGLGNQPPEQIVAWVLERGLSFPILLGQDTYERWAEPDETGPYSLDVVLDQAGVTRAIAHGGEIDGWVALFESLL